MKSAISEPSRITATAQTTPSATIDRAPGPHRLADLLHLAGEFPAMARHPDVVPDQHDDRDEQDRGVENLLPDARQRLGDHAGEGGDEAGAEHARRDAGRDDEPAAGTPFVTASTMPTMRPASMISRKTMISAPSIASPYTACRRLTAPPESLRSSLRGSRRRSDSGPGQRTQVDGDLPAAGDDFFDPQHLAFEFRGRLVLVDDLDDDRLAGRRGRLGGREFVILERHAYFRDLIRDGERGAHPDGDRKAETYR